MRHVPPKTLPKAKWSILIGGKRKRKTRNAKIERRVDLRINAPETTSCPCPYSLVAYTATVKLKGKRVCALAGYDSMKKWPCRIHTNERKPDYYIEQDLQSQAVVNEGDNVVVVVVNSAKSALYCETPGEYKAVLISSEPSSSEELHKVKEAHWQAYVERKECIGWKRGRPLNVRSGRKVPTKRRIYRSPEPETVVKTKQDVERSVRASTPGSEAMQRATMERRAKADRARRADTPKVRSGTADEEDDREEAPQRDMLPDAEAPEAPAQREGMQTRSRSREPRSRSRTPGPWAPRLHPKSRAGSLARDAAEAAILIPLPAPDDDAEEEEAPAPAPVSRNTRASSRAASRARSVARVLAAANEDQAESRNNRARSRAASRARSVARVLADANEDQEAESRNNRARSRAASRARSVARVLAAANEDQEPVRRGLGRSASLAPNRAQEIRHRKRAGTEAPPNEEVQARAPQAKRGRAASRAPPNAEPSDPKPLIIPRVNFPAAKRHFLKPTLSMTATRRIAGELVLATSMAPYPAVVTPNLTIHMDGFKPYNAAQLPVAYKQEGVPDPDHIWVCNQCLMHVEVNANGKNLKEVLNNISTSHSMNECEKGRPEQLGEVVWHHETEDLKIYKIEGRPRTKGENAFFDRISAFAKTQLPCKTNEGEDCYHFNWFVLVHDGVVAGAMSEEYEPDQFYSHTAKDIKFVCFNAIACYFVNLPYRGRKYGTLFHDLSMAYSAMRGLCGSAERPLSPEGSICFSRFLWTHILGRLKTNQYGLISPQRISFNDLIKTTNICDYDLRVVLKNLGHLEGDEKTGFYGSSQLWEAADRYVPNSVFIKGKFTAKEKLTTKKAKEMLHRQQNLGKLETKTCSCQHWMHFTERLNHDLGVPAPDEVAVVMEVEDEPDEEMPEAVEEEEDQAAEEPLPAADETPAVVAEEEEMETEEAMEDEPAVKYTKPTGIEGLDDSEDEDDDDQNGAVEAPVAAPVVAPVVAAPPAANDDPAEGRHNSAEL